MLTPGQPHGAPRDDTSRMDHEPGLLHMETVTDCVGDCFTSTETIRLIRDGRRWAAGDRETTSKK